MRKMKKDNPKICWHDYKNAVKVGNVDHMCPLCKELLDPGTWFIMNYFNTIDVTPPEIKKKLKMKVGVNIGPD